MLDFKNEGEGSSLIVRLPLRLLVRTWGVGVVELFRGGGGSVQRGSLGTQVRGRYSTRREREEYQKFIVAPFFFVLSRRLRSFI